MIVNSFKSLMKQKDSTYKPDLYCDPDTLEDNELYFEDKAELDRIESELKRPQQIIKISYKLI